MTPVQLSSDSPHGYWGKVYSITVNGKTAPLTEKPVGSGAETTGYATKGYSIYKNKVDHTCDVDLRRGEGEVGAITYVVHRIRLRSLQKVVIYGKQNGWWSKSGLPAHPWDEEWNRPWRHWRRRGKRWQT